MKPKVLGIVLIALIAASVVLYLFVARSKPIRSKAMDIVSCRLKWLHQSQFAGMYAAESVGYFEQSGIKCTLRPGGQELNAIKLVATGSDDFGVWSADQVIIAQSQGIPVVALAVIFQVSPVCFFSRKDSAIRTPKDFVGKKVAMQYGTNVRTEYVAMMKRVGVDLATVTEVPTRYSLQQFLKGEVDVWNGYSTNEPLVAEENGVPVQLIKPSEYGVDMYADCIITSQRTIEERPDLVRRFVEAAIQGWDYALAHREESVRLVLEKDSRLTEEHERRMLDASALLILGRSAEVHGIGWMEESIWLKMLNELTEQDLLGPHPINLSQVYTNAFLQSDHN